MATTLRNATLTVTVKEEIVLNGNRQDSENILRISDINEIYKRIITCPANSETTLSHFHSSVADGTLAPLDIDDVKYIRVTNLDASEAIELAVVTVNTTYQIKLDAGQSHVLGSANDLMLAEADTSPSFGTMDDVKSLQVNPGSNAVDVEVFIASS